MDEDRRESEDRPEPDQRRKERPDFWFPAKPHGFGWGPANCWQGLLVQAGYLIFVITSAWLLLLRDKERLFWILFSLATAAFVAIHWWKGETLRWFRRNP